jgi:hypothetical protein
MISTAEGRLLTASRQPVPTGDIRYRIVYTLSESEVEIGASASGQAYGSAPLRLIVPVIARDGEQAEQVDSQTARIVKPKGILTASTDAAGGFDDGFKVKNFNLVPGFEAVPFTVTIPADKEVRIRLRAETKV